MRACLRARVCLLECVLACVRACSSLSSAQATATRCSHSIAVAFVLPSSESAREGSVCNSGCTPAASSALSMVSPAAQNRGYLVACLRACMPAFVRATHTQAFVRATHTHTHTSVRACTHALLPSASTEVGLPCSTPLAGALLFSHASSRDAERGTSPLPAVATITSSTAHSRTYGLQHAICPAAWHMVYSRRPMVYCV